MSIPATENAREYIDRLNYNILRIAFILSSFLHLIWVILYYNAKELTLCILTFTSLFFQVLAYFLNQREQRQLSLFIAIISILAYKSSIAMLGRYTGGNEYSILILIAFPFLMHEISINKKVVLTTLSLLAFFYINFHVTNDHKTGINATSLETISSALRFLIAASFFCLWGYFFNKTIEKHNEAQHVLQSKIDKHNLAREREKIEKEQNNRLNELMQSLPGGVFQYKISPQNEIDLLYISKGSEQVWGINIEGDYPSSKDIFSRIHPDDINDYREHVKESNINNEPVVQTFRVVWPCGTIKWILANSYPTLQRDGSIIRTGSILDITDQKNKEFALWKNLEKSDNDLLKVLDAIPLGVFLKNSTGEIIFANSAYCQIVCETKDSISYKKSSELVFKSISTSYDELELMDNIVLNTDEPHKLIENIRITNRNDIGYIFNVFKTMIKPNFSDEELVLTLLIEVTKINEAG